LKKQVSTAWWSCVFLGPCFTYFRNATLVTCPGGAATCYYRDPIAGNDLSAMINPVSKNSLQYWPNPTSSALVNNYVYSAAVVSNWPEEYSIRVDQNISDKSGLFARWSQKREFKSLGADVYGPTDPGGGEEMPSTIDGT
jgi:hypothetical protein